MPELVLIGSRAAARYCPEVAAGLGPQTDVDLIASPAKAAELRALEGVCGVWDHGGGCVGFELCRPGCWSTTDHIDLEEAAPGTTAAQLLAIAQGAPVQRVTVAGRVLEAHVLPRSWLAVVYRSCLHVAHPKFLSRMNTYCSLRASWTGRPQRPLPADHTALLRQRIGETDARVGQPTVKLKGMTRAAFFGETRYRTSLSLLFEHDAIHEAVALGAEPAYRAMLVGEVECSRAAWEQMPDAARLACFQEEAMVIAIERILAPMHCLGEQRVLSRVTPERALEWAASAVCTSLSSGWFRSFCI